MEGLRVDAQVTNDHRLKVKPGGVEVAQQLLGTNAEAATPKDGSLI